ncbi:MAG: glutamine--fructose-6-phosphate transaminase (isomerizing) [Clostridiales bacterium]|nr:glutamine--fructose-6-phosphate transaminase (isomerizing) [Clostridiales bacterium]
MCGIIGCIGRSEATGILINGLKGLEYRGYDSGGIAVLNKNKLTVVKSKGEIKHLEEKLAENAPEGYLGIGHTRWATHGKATETNAHPHCSKHFAVVHNGIIENYKEIKESLILSGISFVSETDTEVIPKLLELNYSGDVIDALKKTLKILEGSYALGIICTDKPDTLYCAKKGSPLIIGVGKNENYISSDINPLLSHTKQAVYLDDGETAEITESEIIIYDSDFNKIKKEIKKIELSGKQASKGDFKHFMLKEIYEEPEVVRKTIDSVTRNGDVVLNNFPFTNVQIKNLSRIYIIGCGSAYHVGLIAKYNFEKTAKIPTFADYAGEFRYSNPVIDENCLVIIMSQSGETADSLAALKQARACGAKTISIVNVPESSIAKMSDYNILTKAGAEIAVATTKAFSCQLAVLNMLCLYIARVRDACTEVFSEIAVNMSALLPKKIEKVLENSKELKMLAESIKDIDKCFFLGRNADYGVSLEGALKLKEISYIDCAGYPASELKHGTISLIEKGTVCFGLISSKDLLAKTASNLIEVTARGARVIVFAPESLKDELKQFETVISYPDSVPFLTPFIEVMPLQLLAYYVADAKSLPIDKPRNLAKSVTVE